MVNENVNNNMYYVVVGKFKIYREGGGEHISIGF